MNMLKVNDAQAVIVGKLIHKGEGENQYSRDRVMVLEILHNKTNSHFSREIEVAYYSFEEGVPADEECVLYLEPYPLGSKYNDTNGWMLLGGGAMTGIDTVN